MRMVISRRRAESMGPSPKPGPSATATGPMARPNQGANMTDTSPSMVTRRPRASVRACSATALRRCAPITWRAA